MNIVFLSTAWGPKLGGINSFNADLATALAQTLGGNDRVFCATPSAQDVDLADAFGKGVTLLNLSDKVADSRFDEAWIDDVVRELRKIDISHVDWWVGHDVITGAAALRAEETYGGRSTLIHHMSYARYQGVKTDDPVRADQKSYEQVELFRRSKHEFAVGPLLSRAAKELTGRKAFELIPGFPANISDHSSDDRIVGITFGRMEHQDDRIKQGLLAVSGFARSVKAAREAEDWKNPLRESSFYILGLGDRWLVEAEQIQKQAEREAQAALNIVPLPYDASRKMLLARLERCNLALMLSWHEGFGLAGWEAIAAETPLILSRNSGLYELLERSLPGIGPGCVEAVDIRGKRGSPEQRNFHPEDLDAVVKSIKRIAGNLEAAKNRARELKQQLVSRLGCTWGHTAASFIEELSGGTKSLSPPVIETEEWNDVLLRGTVTNALPEVVELEVSSAQGKLTSEFDLLVDTRFGNAEFAVDDCTVEYGVREASLHLEMVNFSVKKGERLGDAADVTPHVRASGGNRWQISGPVEREVIMRRALGAEALCRLQRTSKEKAKLLVEISCRPRDIHYTVHDVFNTQSAIDVERVLNVFLEKTLSQRHSIVVLSQFESEEI